MAATAIEVIASGTGFICENKELDFMLVLSRKLSEEIIVGDNIRIKVMRIAGGRVQLNMDAPRDVRIRRIEATPKSVELVGCSDDERP